MLARKVVTRRGRRIRGYYPSRKLGRMVAWESLLERDALLLLEFSPGVIFYQEQPTVVTYPDGNGVRQYFPDFELVLHDGVRVHLEVKPLSKLLRPSIAKRFDAVISRYASRGQEFRIVTEQEIRREPLMRNVRQLDRLARTWRCDLPGQAELVRELGTGPSSFGHVRQLFGSDAAWHLLAEQRLYCNLMRLITDNATVFVASGGRHASILL